MMCDQDEDVSNMNANFRGLAVKVDRTMGALSQGFSDYPILILSIDADIGIMLVMSLLKELLRKPGNVK
jgi:hypothetical protein